MQFYLRELTEQFSLETARNFKRANLFRLFADKLSGAIKARPKLGSGSTRRGPGM